MGDIELCVPALRRYASSLLRDREEADDLVHDCLRRALDQLDSLPDYGNLRTWLFTILHNLFANRAGRSIRRPRPASPDSIPEERQNLVRALDELTEQERSVLLLVCLENFTYADVSRVLAIPIEEVMSRLRRARERLRQRSVAALQGTVGRVE